MHILKGVMSFHYQREREKLARGKKVFLLLTSFLLKPKVSCDFINLKKYHGTGFPLASEMCAKQLNHIFCLPLNMAFELVRSISQVHLSKGEKFGPTAVEALKHWFHMYIPKGEGIFLNWGGDLRTCDDTHTQVGYQERRGI